MNNLIAKDAIEADVIVEDKASALKPTALSPVNFIIKLSWIQSTLKAPKNQQNSFGGYNYRSAEDILEAVKPLLYKAKLALTISDDLVEVGGHVYVKATARITDGKNVADNVAFARESFDKKGMDAAQMTGSASSYARKYALNGLFCIDDTKDPDTDAYHKATAR